MAKKAYLGNKHRFEFLLDDCEGNRHLTKKRYYYSMSDDEYDDLMEVVESGGEYKSDNPFVMQTYDGLVREAINKMAELMVSDTEYRAAILSTIKKVHKKVRKDVKDGGLNYYDTIQFSECLDGLNFCMPIVEAFFKAPIADDEREDIIFNLANVLLLIQNKYFQLVECCECIDSEC